MNRTTHRIAADLVLRERVSLHRQQQWRRVELLWRWLRILVPLAIGFVLGIVVKYEF